MNAMTGRGWLVLAAVCTMGMIATFNLAQHPTPSLSAFHLDELRQHQPRLHRAQGRASAGPGMAADAQEKLAAAHQAAQVAGSDSAGAAAAASDAVVAGIDKPLTAVGKQRTSGEPAAAPHASAGPSTAPAAASDPALVGIEKPIGVASSQVADTNSAAVASAATPAASAAAADGQQAAGGQDAASAAAPGPGDAVQQQLLSQRVCGSPAIDGYAHVKPECLYTSPAAKWWQAWEAGGGRREELAVHIERNADFDGLAVAWGIGNTKASVEECAEACRQHKAKPSGSHFEPLPCNAFTYCPDDVCFEPDAHKHSKGDCWLKFTEGPASPEVNFRGEIRAQQRARHPTAPLVVQWHSGVLLPNGVRPDNGTWSPRYDW